MQPDSQPIWKLRETRLRNCRTTTSLCHANSQSAKSQELNQRRELVHASDEIENLKKKHGREVMDLEMDIKKRDREIREVTEDLRICRSDLDRERETVSTLKKTITQQSTSHLTLTTQNHGPRSTIDSTSFPDRCIREHCVRIESQAGIGSKTN